MLKMVYPQSLGNNETTREKVTTVMTSGYTRIKRNWIFYRLTDVMLMKAEALVQLADEDAGNLQRAFSLVNTVNKRSIAKATLGATDTLQLSRYTTKAQMEELVLQERQRELCFEGKRWFDLLRYTYRQLRAGENSQAALLHPDKTMHEIGELGNFPETSNILMGVMDQDVQISMESEPYLYFPVLMDELNVNPLLNQNPAYIKNETIVKQ